ncbi:MAG: hypothetical protein ACTSP5_10050 [Candidatus Heimdallarchaeota archaeon]
MVDVKTESNGRGKINTQKTWVLPGFPEVKQMNKKSLLKLVMSKNIFVDGERATTNFGS